MKKFILVYSWCIVAAWGVVACITQSILFAAIAGFAAGFTTMTTAVFFLLGDPWKWHTPDQRFFWRR